MVAVIRFVSSLIEVSKGIPYIRSLVSLALLFGVVSGLANAGLVALINKAINAPVEAREGWALAFLGLCVALPVSRVLAQVLLVRIGARTVVELRMSLARQILRVPLRQLEKLGPSRLMAVLTEDITNISDTVIVVPMLCMHLAVVAGTLGYLGWLSWPLFLALLVVMVVGVITYYLPLLKAFGHVRLFREAWDTMYEHFEALTKGTKELKLHRGRRDTFLSEGLNKTADKHMHHQVMGVSIFVLASSWGQVLFFVVIGLLLFIAPNYQAVPMEVLTGFTLVLLYLTTPMEFILNRMPDLANANTSMNKIRELGFSLRELPDDMGTNKQLQAPFQRLELRGVEHHYEGSEDEEGFSVGPVSLSLEPGEVIFLVGGNGSGKTTLAKTLIGLYEPDGGEILVDGRPVTDADRDSYRQLFTAVFSDFYLFESLLGLGGPDLDTQAHKYLSELHLEKKVKVEEGVLSTLDLSQGQRKRLALLTAYLEDRPIYLFDEWAADQDPQFKQIFYRELLPELRARGKAVVVISHDDQYYDAADRIYRFDFGQMSQVEAADYRSLSAG
ncbi:MAG: cyclic peptide export ABC transporter [Acidobacteriota bacterium]|nr:cyclic peptide export ABC transporter [Acidobacteriota bacterium]